MRRNGSVCKPAKCPALQFKGLFDGYARVQQRLNQAQPVVHKPKRKQGRPIHKKSSPALSGQQRRRNSEEDEPVITAKSVGCHTQRKIDQNAQTDGYLPGLYALFEKNI